MFGKLAVLAALAAGTAVVAGRILAGHGIAAGTLAALAAGALAGGGLLTGSIGPVLLFGGLGVFMGVVDADGVRVAPVGSFLIGFFVPIVSVTGAAT